jgi:hypothetical protein
MRPGSAFAASATIAIALSARAAAADVLVDDFEDVSDWTGLTKETQTVHDGAAAGRWGDQLKNAAAQKKLAPPLDVTGAAHLRFWAWSAKPNGAAITLTLDSDDPKTPAWDYYSAPLVVDWTGWKLVVLPLADLGVANTPLGFGHIGSIAFHADGWGHAPLADTTLVLDGMWFGAGVLSGVEVDRAWKGGDYVYTFTAALEDRLGKARSLAFAIDAPNGFDFLAAVTTPTVSLPAKGKGSAVATITVPAASITPASRLALERAELVATEQGAVVDGATLEAAVPLDPRAHPRTLLAQADFDRVAQWAAKDAWATAARDGVVTGAKAWPAPFLAKYGVKSAALPPEGGQWTAWYVCPKHGVHLAYTPPMTHTCPVDQQTLSGWPYDQVVYAWMQSDLADAARDLGLAYRLSGDASLAASAASILLAYADAYASWPLHDTNGHATTSGARALAQTLDEAIWLVSIAWAYDLVADSAALDDTKRAHIERDLLGAASGVVARNHAGASNWQAWHNAGTSAAAFATDDPVGIAKALESPTDGFAFQMGNSVTADGFWYEGSWGYHLFALDALMKTAEMATRAGVDLWSDKRLRSMFEGPLGFAMPDGSLPPFNDTGATSLQGSARYYEAAYARYQDPKLTSFLGGATRGRDALFFGAETLPSGAPPDLGSLIFPDAGFAVLRAGTGKDTSYLALKFGPHGGWHGHYDKLGNVFYARGGVLGVDPGTQSYAAPTHTTWDKVTLAHDTVVVDEATQAEATGKLHRFVALPGASMAAADAGAAYAQASLLRTMLMTPEYVIDRFHVAATDATTHAIDWIHHAPGVETASVPTNGPVPLPASNGYQHLSNTAAAKVDDAFQVAFQQKPAPGPCGSAWPSAAGVVASYAYSQDQAVSGTWSGKAAYDFSKATGYVLYATPTLDPVAEKPTALRVEVYGDGSGNKLSFRVNDATDERFVFDAGPMDFTGWKAFDLPGIEGWQHYLGNADGVFDAPAKSVTVGVTHVVGATAASAVHVDDVHLAYAVAGDVLVTDFERPARGLRLWMAAEAGTTLVTGNGLGPDLLAPVPFAMARRKSADTTFLTLLEPFGDAPVATKLETLATSATAADEAMAAVIAAPGWTDRVLGLADGKGGTPRTFGDASCDGTMCLLRDDAASVRRAVLTEGTTLADGATTIVLAKAALPALQADWDAAGERIDLVVAAPIATELRLLGPKVADVFVGGVATPFTRDGDYVVLNLEGAPDAGVGGGASHGGAAQGGAGQGGTGHGGGAVGDAGHGGVGATSAGAGAGARGPAAAPGDAGTDGDGCGCEAAGRPGGSLAGIGVLTAIAVAARRRRVAGGRRGARRRSAR